MKVSIDTNHGPELVRAYEIRAGLAITKILCGGQQGKPRFGKNYVVTHLPTGKTISANAVWGGFALLAEAKRFLNDMAALGDWSQWATAKDVPAKAKDACLDWLEIQRPARRGETA